MHSTQLKPRPDADHEVYGEGWGCPQTGMLSTHLGTGSMTPYMHAILEVPKTPDCHAALGQLPYYVSDMIQRYAQPTMTKGKVIRGMLRLPIQSLTGIHDLLPAIHPVFKAKFHRSKLPGQILGLLGSSYSSRPMASCLRQERHHMDHAYSVRHVIPFSRTLQHLCRSEGDAGFPTVSMQ